MTPKIRAQSSTDRVSGPILSMLQARLMQPWRLTRPKVGRRPVVPHWREGDTMLPRVSLPSANAANPAAVAAADPADEPLDPSLGFHGVRVMPLNHLSPMPSAPGEGLAMITAPPPSSLYARVALAWRSGPGKGAAPR